MEEWTDEEKFEEVCRRIEKGQSLRTILTYGNVMSNTLFYKLLNERPDLNERYARAREVYASDIFDEILEIADESNADIVTSEEGKMYVQGEVVQRSKLKIDARKWVLAKLNPKKYGDKMEIEGKHEHTGEFKITDLIKFKD